MIKDNPFGLLRLGVKHQLTYLLGVLKYIKNKVTECSIEEGRLNFVLFCCSFFLFFFIQLVACQRNDGKLSVLGHFKADRQ